MQTPEECDKKDAVETTLNNPVDTTPTVSEEPCSCSVCVRHLTFTLNDTSRRLRNSEARTEVLKVELESVKEELKETRSLSVANNGMVGCICDHGMKHAAERFRASKDAMLRQLRERVEKSFQEQLSTVISIQEEEVHNLALPFQALNKSPCNVGEKSRLASLGSLDGVRELDFSTEDSQAKEDVKPDMKTALGDTLSFLMSGLHALSPAEVIKKTFTEPGALEDPRVLKLYFFLSLWSECYRTHGLENEWKELGNAIDAEISKLLQAGVRESPGIVEEAVEMPLFSGAPVLGPRHPTASRSKSISKKRRRVLYALNPKSCDL
ncbi:hypothetical protein FGB62_291g06 [Gracilaria domingensis]|nr:hypothetical protein FGB62_291g06 [Gracilaria domingensis]